MMSNDSSINVETKAVERTKWTKLHSIHLQFLHCNISHLLTIIIVRDIQMKSNNSTINVKIKAIK